MTDDDKNKPTAGDDKQKNEAGKEAGKVKDGPGAFLNIEKARLLLQEKHNIVVDGEDPVLLLVTLHQAFIADYQTMLGRHDAALTQMIGEAVAGLTQSAMAENLKANSELAEKSSRAFESQYRRAKLLTISNFCAVIVCIPVLIYLLVK